MQGCYNMSDEEVKSRWEELTACGCFDDDDRVVVEFLEDDDERLRWLRAVEANRKWRFQMSGGKVEVATS